MARFAEGTTISAARSKAEIEVYLEKRGAKSIATYMDEAIYAVLFEVHARRIKFTIPVPTRDDPYIRHTESGRVRDPKAIDQALDRERMRLWRALHLVIKAKFEAVDSNIFTFEQEFLAHMMIPGATHTVFEEVQPALADRYAGLPATPLLQIGGV